jgi:hypothetical protein
MSGWHVDNNGVHFDLLQLLEQDVRRSGPRGDNF